MKLFDRLIESIKLDEDRNCIILNFQWGKPVEILDAARECCELRYISTDDDLSEASNSMLFGIEIKNVGYLPADDEDDDNYGCHEIQFLELKTSKGCFTFTTHNQHNGHYGGFEIEIVEVENT